MAPFLSCLALPWLSPSLACPALPSSSNNSRSLFASTYERRRNETPQTGKPSAAPKPPKRETKPDARPEAPLRQIASDRLLSPQIAISFPPAHLTPLIKPFLPVVPQKQGVSISRYPKRPRRPLSSFLPKEEGGRRSHATPVASQTVLFVPGWIRALVPSSRAPSPIRGWYARRAYGPTPLLLTLEVVIQSLRPEGELQEKGGDSRMKTAERKQQEG